MKVRMKVNHPLLADILPLGFDTELLIKRSKEDVLVPEMYSLRKGKMILLSPSYIIPAGNYEGYIFMGDNGEVYGDAVINYVLGPRAISEVFEKI